jgi:hypothetical protein
VVLVRAAGDVVAGGVEALPEDHGLRTDAGELGRGASSSLFGSLSGEFERHRSLGPDGSVWADSATREYDPPRRLVHGWRSLYDPELAEEAESRVTWEIEPQDGGYCKLTVTHDELEGAPKTAESVSGAGWMMVLSGLKTLLETGEPLAG